MTGTPVVAADDRVVYVDLVVELDPRSGDTSAAAWRHEDDVTVRAVALTIVRLRAAKHPSADLLVDRAGLAADVEEALRVAPGPSAYDVRAVSVEIGRDEPETSGEVTVSAVDATPV